MLISEYRAPFDVGASRELMGFHQTPIDAREYREVIILAADRYVGTLDPLSTTVAVAQVVRDHVAEFSAWPEYQEVAVKLGLAPRYVCTLRNIAIKGIIDFITRVI